jgi:Uma2 family endonuclease
MGMPLELERHWSAEEVRQDLLSDAPWPRYELIDGELIVTPSPSLPHNWLGHWLYDTLNRYLEREPLGRVRMSQPSDLELLPGTISQPDLFVVPTEDFERARRWSDIRRLLLAVEILSPGTARYDRGPKRRHYQSAGVAEYWIIDPPGRVIERWRPHDDRPEVITRRMTWHPSGAAAALEFDLDAFFASAPLDQGD